MNLERAVLLVLSTHRPAVTANIIAGQIGQFTSIPATITDICQTLSRLESKGQAIGTAADEDRGAVWMITAEGRLRIG